MANDKDFVVKNPVEVSESIEYSVGTITSSDLDLSTGNYFNDTLVANTTYTFSNPGDVQTFLIEITGASTYTVTWPGTVEWEGGSAAAAPAAGQINLYSITTDDTGTTYIGKLVSTNSS